MLSRLRRQALARVHRSAFLAVAAAQHVTPLPDLAGTVEVETTFARLLLDERDEWITPTLTATSGWEPGNTALLGKRVQPAMTVIDGGAHVGYFTCQAARLAGPRGLVLRIRAGAADFQLLQANVWRNGFTNVVCFPWALGASPASRSRGSPIRTQATIRCTEATHHVRRCMFAWPLDWGLRSGHRLTSSARRAGKRGGGHAGMSACSPTRRACC